MLSRHVRCRQAARIVIAQLLDDPPPDHADREEQLKHLGREIEIGDGAASEDGEP